MIGTVIVGFVVGLLFAFACFMAGYRRAWRECREIIKDFPKRSAQ